MQHATRFLKVFLVAALLCVVPAPSFAAAFIGVSVNIGPPALPVYVQPPCPVAGELWTPGYWGWGPGGYYWVPGTWVAPPAPGLVWTPGYWGRGAAYYAWHPGYWGPHIGFYGGVNYGFGYFGAGYVGGGWFGNVFRYNTAVTNVNTTVVRNVYVNKTVVVNNYNTTVNRVSYNGGPGGVKAQPTAEEQAAAQERQAGLSAAQRRHVNLASRDRNLLASVNNGHPAQLAVDHPYAAANRPPDFTPLQAQDRQSARNRVVSGGAGNGSFARNPSPASTGHAATIVRTGARNLAIQRLGSLRQSTRHRDERRWADDRHAAVRQRLLATSASAGLLATDAAAGLLTTRALLAPSALLRRKSKSHRSAVSSLSSPITVAKNETFALRRPRSCNGCAVSVSRAGAARCTRVRRSI